jgi:site-specific recombinase XerD
MKLVEALEAFDLAQNGAVSPRTRATHRQRLGYLARYFGGDRPVGDLSAEDLRRWRAWLLDSRERYSEHPVRPPVRGGLAAQTVKGLVKAVRHFCRWLMDEGLIREDPAASLQPVRVPKTAPKAISKRDMQRMLRVAREHPRDYAMVRLLADTGCRVGGLVGLRVGDLDLARRRAIVIEKGGKTRPVYFGEATARALADWLHTRRAGSEYVFPGGRQGEPLTPQGVHRALARLAKRAGVKGRYNAHAFRHALARGMLEEGSDLGTVSRVLGHADITTTHRFYAVWDDRELAERKDRYTPDWEKD